MKKQITIVGMFKVFAALTVQAIGEVKRMRATDMRSRLAAASWTMKKLDRLAR